MDNEPSPSAQIPYERASPQDADRTHFYAEVVLIPAAVADTFCCGHDGDEYKVSRRWAFRKGELIFTVYDWKATSPYESGMWTPDELWSSWEPFPLHIGSKEPATDKNVAEFAKWLQKVTLETD